MKKSKKWLSILLCAALLLGLLPTVALAEGEPFTPGIRVDSRGMDVSVKGATKVESSDDEYTFNADAESVTVTITGENYHGIRVRSFRESADDPWSYQRLEGGVYTITDLTKSYEIEVFDWEPPLYDNEFVVGYDSSDDFTVQLKGETVKAWGNVETFTEDDLPLTITTSEPPYKVVVRPNDSNEIELQPGANNSYTYNPTTNVNAGFELLVYRTEAEYKFDTISCDWENEFIAEYQVRFDRCDPDDGCTVTYQVVGENNLVQAMSYNGRTRLVLNNNTTQVKLTITAAEGYIYEVWADGKDVTESVVGNVYSWTFGENSDGWPEIVFRSENQPGPEPEPEPIPENGVQFQLHGPERGTVSYKIGNAEYTTVDNKETESTDVNSDVITVENESTVTFKVQPEETDGYFEVHIDSNPAEAEGIQVEWDTEKYKDFMEALAAGESVSFTAKANVGYSIRVDFGQDELPWYTVSWSGANVTVDHGTVTAERVHLGDKIFTVYKEESGKDSNDNIYPIEDIISKEGQEGLGVYGLGYGDTDLFIGNEVTESVSIDFKFVPDYGYQLSDILTNGTDSLLSGFTASASEISTFNFAVRPDGGNVHFNVVFAAAEDTIDVTGSAKVSGASIANGGNAIDSGNLKLTVADLDENKVSDKLKAQAGESALYLDMNLYQVVSKGGENGNWENQLEDLSDTITVTLEVPAPAAGSSYYIVREHGDGNSASYDRIEVKFVPDANDPTKGTVTFETDKFSNYALAQEADITPDTEKTSDKVYSIAVDTDSNYTWADTLPDSASAATAVKLIVADNTSVATDTQTSLKNAAGGVTIDETKSFYLDLTMTATVGSDDIPITDLKQPVTVTLTVPAISESEQYIVVREHNGVYTVLTCTYDRENNKLTFQTDRFSTYAVFVSARSASVPDPGIPMIPVGSTYSVTAAQPVNGAVTVSPANAAAGVTVTVTVTPDEGYELASLTVTDAGGKDITLTDKGDGTYTFTMPASGVNIKATFAEIDDSCDGGVTCPSYHYTDVNTNLWYHEAIDYVTENGIMNGVGDGKFDPNGNLSRAMLMTMLARLDGVDTTGAIWYEKGLNWAVETGISDGTNPGSDISRQEVATMLYRYAQLKGYDTTKSASLSTFVDGDQTASWAQDAMEWAVANGIFQGDDNSVLNPKGSATRAEVAQIFKNFMENTNK